VALRSSHLVIHFLTANDLPLAELFGTDEAWMGSKRSRNR
jgi:hypothetical protein